MAMPQCDFLYYLCVLRSELFFARYLNAVGAIGRYAPILRLIPAVRANLLTRGAAQPNSNCHDPPGLSSTGIWVQHSARNGTTSLYCHLQPAQLHQVILGHVHCWQQ